MPIYKTLKSWLLRCFDNPGLRRTFYILLPVAISLYLFYPLFSGMYLYYSPEYDIYKSFMVNFIETLKRFELPIWNEYVGSGYPAIYFGQYPINQNTLFYMLFAYNDFTAYFTKCISVIILLLSFIYACRFLKLSYLIALAGALTYFSINLVIRFIIADTLGNLFLVYPLLMIFIYKIIVEKKTKDILFFNLTYIFWLSGCHIAWIHEALFMLFLVYWITLFVNYGRETFTVVVLKKYTGLFFILFALPLLSVIYQYYFLIDVVTHSIRYVREGLIVSPFEFTAWKQLLISLRSSSYVWVGLLFILMYAMKNYIKSEIKNSSLFISVYINENDQIIFQIGKTIQKLFVFVLIILMLMLMIRLRIFHSIVPIFEDYIPILSSRQFLIALIVFVALGITKHRKEAVINIGLKSCLLFIINVSLLSYYLFSPSNIAEYDTQFFKELNASFRFIFILCVLYASREYRDNKIVKIAVLSAICLYIIRSHLTILLLRFTGIIWYSVRDGAIFSLFFAILFMFGLKNLLYDISNIVDENKWVKVKYVERFILLLIVGLLIHGTYAKFYHGRSNRLIFSAQKTIAKTTQEKWIIDNREDLGSLKSKLFELRQKTNHFFRTFIPEIDMVTGMVLAGNSQQYKIHEAALYDCTIPKELKIFFDKIILGKSPPDARILKNVIQCGVFTKHIHDGLKLKVGDVLYSDLFALQLFPNDLRYIEEKNMEFFWDLMQVKYLVTGPEFSESLGNFTHFYSYQLLAAYPALRSNLYEITKNKPYSPYAFLPLGKNQTYEEILRQLNSPDIDVLQSLYGKLIFPDDTQKDFMVLNAKRGSANRYYEIESKREAMLIEFESWNHSWEAIVNNKSKTVEKAFHILKGIHLTPGLNHIQVTYHLKYFNFLFWLGVITILIYITLLGRQWFKEKASG